MPGRQERVAVAIRKEIAQTVLSEMRDPRLAMVTITSATVSRDLTQARVFVSALGGAAELNEAIEAMNAAKGFIRSKIGPRLGLRVVPDVHFVADDSAAKAQRLERIFREDAAGFAPIDTPLVLEDIADDEDDLDDEDLDDELDDDDDDDEDHDEDEDEDDE